MIVERIWFQKIYNVEPVDFSCLNVLDFEVIPLSVSSCVIVWF